MRSRIAFLGFVALAFGPLGAAPHPPAAVETLPAEWRVSLDGGRHDHQEQSFRAESEGVEVQGSLGFNAGQPMLWLRGVYRTRQALDPRAKLSFQLYSEDGTLLQLDGRRFEWRSSADGGREAEFYIENVVAGQPGLHALVRVQFNYVVENEYWYRDRHPEMFLPQLAVEGPARPAQFGVSWALVPPILPVQTEVELPAWIRAEYAGAPPPYSASLDMLAANGPARIEGVRKPLPPALKTGRSCFVGYGMGDVDGQSVRVRPGFVWEGVEWFGSYGGNPYRKVRLVGPLTYAVGLTLSVLCLLAAWKAVGRVQLRGLRWAGRVLWGGVALGLLLSVAVSLYPVLVAALALIWWLQRRIQTPGSRVYWTMCVFLVMLDLYWGHVIAGARGLWIASLLSASLAALVLLPLRWLKRPISAALVGTGLGLPATLVATAIALYFGFFHDYPGLRDLLYAGQIGDVGDSVVLLVDQRHLVPWWLWACTMAGLWRR